MYLDLDRCVGFKSNIDESHVCRRMCVHNTHVELVCMSASWTHRFHVNGANDGNVLLSTDINFDMQLDIA